MQRKEDPDTQAGFYTTCNSARTWNVLALPRDAMGRKLKRVKDRRGNLMKAKADYYRIIRPATGFSSEDLSASGVLQTPTMTRHSKQQGYVQK